MELSYVQSYAGSPERVVDLMRNEAFITDVAEHAGALSHEVTVDGDTLRLAMALGAPSDLAKFIGSTINLVQTFRWGEPDAAGVRRGQVDVDVKGMPVTVKAGGELRRTGDEASEARFTGDLRVNIPLVGKKVERQVEPFIADAFGGLERRANAWLTRDQQA